MKQFQKYGIAAAVASIAAGAVAQAPMAPEVSKNEAGDLAIVPYYTVVDGKNTGVHIVNTTAATQVVKVRLRRGADSKDALDFNLVMSPYDEWTANIGAGGSTGVQVTTGDTTCTVPEFDNGVAQMPSTYSEGATEGYIEIIGMAQAAREDSSIAYNAKHVAVEGGKPTPRNCDLVRENFFRVPASLGAGIGVDTSVRGIHTSDAASNGGACTGAVGALSTACPITASNNLSTFVDTPDNALKVSFMITDSAGGLEAGDNAVMIEGFASAPMMTNQQPLSFGTAGVLQYDPLNFELPNLAYGAYESSIQARRDAGADGATDISDGTLFTQLRDALDTNSLVNDWAAFEAADGSTVAADWVVTLPGQYAMNNAICDVYDTYAQANTACRYTATAVSAALLDQDELPLILASNTTNNPLSGDTNLSLWDREETALNSTETTDSGDLGFSPGGSIGDPTVRAELKREVNVISFNNGNVLGSSALQDEDFGLRVVVEVPDANTGWAQLAIEPSNGTPALWGPGADAPADDGNVNPNLGQDGFGSFTPISADNTMAVGFAVWERSFADQAGNYGRIIEHTTMSSAR